MRRKKSKDLAKLENGWDTTFCPSFVAEKLRPSLDTDLLNLQAGWSRKLHNETESEDGELSSDRFEFCVKDENAKTVKSGEINYDAPIFLKAINKYHNGNSEEQLLKSISIKSQRRHKIPVKSNRDDNYWEEWKQKWDFVYDFVELEKKRIEAEEKLKKLGNPIMLKSQNEPSFQKINRPSLNQKSNSKFTNPNHNNKPSCNWSRKSADNTTERPKPSLPPITKRYEPQVHQPSPKISWEEFEMKLKTDLPLKFNDIPWPSTYQAILDVFPSSKNRSNHGSKDGDLKEMKTNLRKALLRWHPDKFQKIISRIDDSSDRMKAVQMVQEVTRRIISEKEAAGL